jgi:excisionase family DNA binding protein
MKPQDNTLPLGIEPLITPRELAKIGKWSRAYVYKLAAEGTVPAIRCGRTIRFQKADVLAFLQGTRK